MRVNINVPDELVKRLDEYAKANYTSRSSVMCQACDQYLTAKMMTSLMSELLSVMKDISSKKELSEEDLKSLSEMEAVVKMLESKK